MRISIGVILIFISIYACAVYLYGTARYSGEWNENDTWLLNRAITIAQDSDTLLRAPWTYGNGLAYQSLGLFVAEMTGLSADDVQLFALPIMTALIPIVAFAAYRSLTGRDAIALLAVLLLVIQPDFLFVTWRGSHEKLTWLLTLTLIFLLSRSFTIGVQGKPVLPYMVAFYFVAFALITVNAFFASSFIAALAFSFILGLVWVQVRRRREDQARIRGHLTRLILLSLICFLFLYVFFFYIYPPARQLLYAFRGLVESLSALLFARDPSMRQADSYSYVDLAYVAPYVFIILSGLSFALLGFSALVWLEGARRVLFRRLNLEHLARVLLWLMYAAFAAQLAASVLADRSEAVGSNLQVRLFTPLMIIVLPVAAIGIFEIMAFLRRNRLVFAGAVAVGALVLGTFGVFALAKFTNEPIVNNNWLFVTDAEHRAGNWAATHSYRSLIYEGWNVRTRYPVARDVPSIEPGDFSAGIAVPDNVSYYIWSTIEAARWVRAGLDEPSFTTANLVYDNGEAQVYHRLPRTQYQR
ncbi:MAG: hypothetical protein U0452_01010 [Anaerolineae bacterium]